ncbi:ABC transporter ATP-binding protein [Pseudomonas typographi]|uniref:ABC transporter ATP-binding protein n=1 Tax=Pseudomonas typographi TaxID=2715964 RepID=A0ABR7Z5L0_9PSED|nr:ABC transporter ATP-binding protein [Pseudomonas typographi]MBD1552828.1 ABC transporter ATP-binding protein [Pseudomonas typographi]MBD1586932.1 ABC transporter ATP-binding protein [Pseudomonas typographi]MBD1600609.1 ABC transporter ATP-binding protein [Pseudomonas typographi]
MTLLQADQLSYRLGDRLILDNLSFGIYSGDNIALLGANGAGKSTLLRILLGLLKPTTGRVLLAGQPLYGLSRRAVARQLAYVPQSHVPSFPFSVAHIVAQGRLPATGLGRAPAEADEQCARQALTELGIDHLRARPYTELSGGERQLVLIARAMVQRARVIILDEPITGLDYGHQLRLLGLLQRLAEQGLSVLSSSHRPEQALASANRVLVLHQGQLIADGPPRETIDSALMQRLYRVTLRQIDAAGHRFFVP